MKLASLNGEKIAKLKERFELIRKQGLGPVKRKAARMVNRESLAREFFARKVAIPFLKETLGKGFVSMTLHGSAQLGVRKATSFSPIQLARQSDIDLLVAVPAGQFKDVASRKKLAHACERRLSRAGVPCEVEFLEVEDFLKHLCEQVTLGKPFQVLYGKETILNAGKYVPNMRIDLTSMSRMRVVSSKQRKYFAREYEK